MKLENEKLNEPIKPQLNIGAVSGSFNGIGEMCKRCYGDGWVFHSKSGQSGFMKDCPKCDGLGVVKNCHKKKAIRRMRNKYDFIVDVGGMLRFISAIRQTDRYIEMIYMNGACYQLHLLLKKYSDCEPLINAEMNHVVTKFKGKLFDITGEVRGEYLPMTDKDIEIASRWSFHKTKMIQIGECQVCEEPVLV